MAAAAAASGLSKAEYLRRRYLEPGEAEGEAGSGAKKRRRRKRPKELPGGMRIVDDDVSWKSISNVEGKEEEEVEDGDLPVVAEFIDERPEEVKWMEEFRGSKKWKLLGDHNEESQSSDLSGTAKSNSSEAVKHKQKKHSPESSPPRRGRHNSPDLLHSVTGKSNRRTASGGQEECFPNKHLAHQRQQVTSDLSPPRRKRHDSETDLLPPQKSMPSLAGLRKQGSARGSFLAAKKSQRHDSESESDSAPPRTSTKASSDSDLSPPRAIRCTQPQVSPDLSPRRRNQCGSSDSDLSPPRRGQDVGQKARRSQSPPDLSPPRRARDSRGRGDGEQMLSGGKAGLVSAELLRRERQEFRKQERGSKHLEDESQHAATVFRDRSGRKRDLKQERLEQQKAAQQQSERDEQYAQWGKGLAQSRQQQQNVEDAVKEMQKPLARYIDDQDLDQMLREQEREGDPMANFIKKRKSKEGKDRKEKPKYSGPAPPLNRFNIWPGYRWDGVDRSNGFEQKRFARIASKKAVQELAYKWSVEDM
ncbi:BUD13 homolog isoform X2 [Heteronotia binoei]|uniref:BUD13 homolog isoform X2 n=1 Tax=Heteronotia binoei TaxID=13085 RepID=UPI002931C288|nr:BUD13 homolog isoform X2 [Heteronotia binoei]